MKKLLLLGALISSIAMATNTVEVRAGIDLSSGGEFKGGRYDSNVFKYNLEKNTLKRGFELTAEYRKGITENFEIGGGISYKYNKLNEKRTTGAGLISSSVENKGLSSVPLFFTARYNFKNSSEITPYVKANLGYAFNSGSVKWNDKFSNGFVEGEAKFKGGLYSGIGAGINYKNFIVDLSYNVNGTRITRTNKLVYSPTAGGLVTRNQSEKFNLNHGVVTLGFGYSFGF